ncbi:hypothetical protein NQ318_004840 [Aromia moschata]|uniref:Transposase n=1 Tax=Aromia moschata TaxID=1265417 RepID=A0AAV8Z2L9_9CUCU|nr:hypothetical protein NQ318_004840 [Aromia moschata]
MMSIFFDIRGIAYLHWVPEGQTVNQHYYYIEVLTALRERVRKRRPDLWKTKSWKIHQDNVLTHSALLSCNIHHTRPTLTPVTFLFPKVKSALKGTRSESVETIKANATEVLNELTMRTSSTALNNGKVI